MNERVMQFRIGMFVIVAGLVLTMLLVWFGESPALLQNQRYLTVHYKEAPGVAKGIPVRKSGIRIGQVALIEFDRRPEKGDGVLVTLAIEPGYNIAAGAIPRLSRALIGDVSIDLLPAVGEVQTRDLITSATPAESLREDRVIEGSLAPDPALALAAATQAFERAGTTLTNIDDAAQGIAKIATKAEGIEDLLTTWRETGTRIRALSERLDAVVAENQGQIKPTLDELRQAANRVGTTLDEPTRKNFQQTVQNLVAGTDQLDQILTEIGPLATDLGAAASSNPSPTTQFGQTVMRLNRISYELGLLTAALADPSGKKLNPNGTLQKLVLQSDLHDNLNKTALGIQEIFAALRPMMRSLAEFADRIARDPSVLSRGALQGR